MILIFKLICKTGQNLIYEKFNQLFLNFTF